MNRMDAIEREYRRRIGEWSGQERVARSIALFEEVRAMLQRKILASEPDLDEATVKRRVAECLYRTNPETQRLLSLLDE